MYVEIHSFYRRSVEAINDTTSMLPTPSRKEACAAVKPTALSVVSSPLAVLEVCLTLFRTAIADTVGCLSAEDLTAGQRWERVKNCTSAAKANIADAQHSDMELTIR